MIKRLITLCLLLLLPAGCSIYEASDQPAADQLVTRYHDALQNKQWDSLLALYDPGFFKEQSRDGWQHKLETLFETYGELKRARQTFAQKDPRFRGDYYIYGYRLVFDKRTIDETITIFKGIESEKLTIAGHVIKTAP